MNKDTFELKFLGAAFEELKIYDKVEMSQVKKQNLSRIEMKNDWTGK